MHTDSKGINRDGLVTLGTGLILIFFMLFGNINWTASVVMIVFYIFYLWRLIKAQKNYTNNKKQEIIEYKSEKKSIDKKKVVWFY